MQRIDSFFVVFGDLEQQFGALVSHGTDIHAFDSVKEGEVPPQSSSGIGTRNVRQNVQQGLEKTVVETSR